MSNPLQPGLKPARLLHPWNSPGKNTGVGCHSFLQEIFLTQGSNPGIPHCRQILYRLSHQGSPYVSVSLLIYICTHTHRGLVQHLKAETVFVNQAYSPRVLPCQVISHHLTSPYLTLPASSHPQVLASLQADTFTFCLPPYILLLKSCSRSSSPAIPTLTLLGFLSPASLNCFWYFSGSFCTCIPHAPGPLDCPLLPDRTCAVFTLVLLMGLKQELSDERIATLSL